MRKPSIFFSSILVFFTLGVSPKACSSLCRAGEEGAVGCKSCSQTEGAGCKACNESEGAGCKSCNDSEGGGCKCNSEGCNKSEKTSQKPSDEIPVVDHPPVSTQKPVEEILTTTDDWVKNLTAKENGAVFTEKNIITNDEARALKEKGINFVFHNSKSEQLGKRFKVIYLMPDNINQIALLYQIDELSARYLLNNSNRYVVTSAVNRALSIDHMIALERETLKNGKIPVLVFHNDISNLELRNFNPESNLLTCNSYTLELHMPLQTSTKDLNILGVLKGINQASEGQNLYDFYSQFTRLYSQHEQEVNFRNCVYIIGGVSGIVGGSVTVYYVSS